jgi:hypothetical protein
MDDDRAHWDVPARDAVGRARVLTVAVTSVGEVVIIAPPGASATVPPDRVGGLVAALNEAKSVALRGRDQL